MKGFESGQINNASETIALDEEILKFIEYKRYGDYLGEIAKKRELKEKGLKLVDNKGVEHSGHTGRDKNRRW